VSACISMVYTETVSIYMYIGYKNTGYIYIECKYESMHSTQVLDMYLNIPVLGTCMPGIYIELSLQVCTVSIKL